MLIPINSPIFIMNSLNDFASFAVLSKIDFPTSSISGIILAPLDLATTDLGSLLFSPSSLGFAAVSSLLINALDAFDSLLPSSLLSFLVSLSSWMSSMLNDSTLSKGSSEIRVIIFSLGSSTTISNCNLWLEIEKTSSFFCLLRYSQKINPTTFALLSVIQYCNLSFRICLSFLMWT